LRQSGHYNNDDKGKQVEPSVLMELVRERLKGSIPPSISDHPGADHPYLALSMGEWIAWISVGGRKLIQNPMTESLGLGW
jgi:hypothetical protein